MSNENQRTLYEVPSFLFSSTYIPRRVEAKSYLASTVIYSEDKKKRTIQVVPDNLTEWAVNFKLPRAKKRKQ
jgi:hypothetical protein